VLTPGAGGWVCNENRPENSNSMQLLTQEYGTDESKILSISSKLPMNGMDSQAAPSALYRICESRLYRANVQDSSSVEFSFQVNVKQNFLALIEPAGIVCDKVITRVVISSLLFRNYLHVNG
jgi:hypothetical protein